MGIKKGTDSKVMIGLNGIKIVYVQVLFGCKDWFKSSYANELYPM
jgi:hypothetical protein